MCHHTSLLQNVNKASAPSNRVKSAPTRLSQSRLETLATSMPQLRNTDQGECVITRASYKTSTKQAHQATVSSQRQQGSVSPVLKHLQHQCRSSGTRTKVSVSSHEPLTNKTSTKQAQQATASSQRRPGSVSPVLKHLQHQCRSSGTRTKVSVSSHEPLTKRQQSKRSKQPHQVSADQAQSHLETLATSMPQLRNTDQGECVITRASYKTSTKQAHQATASSQRRPGSVSPVLKHLQHQCRSSGTRTKVSVSSHEPLTNKTSTKQAQQATASSQRRPGSVSPVLKHLQHQCRSSGTRTKVSVSSHEPLTKRQQSKRTKQPCQVSANKAQSVSTLQLHRAPSESFYIWCTGCHFLVRMAYKDWDHGHPAWALAPVVLTYF